MRKRITSIFLSLILIFSAAIALNSCADTSKNANANTTDELLDNGAGVGVNVHATITETEIIAEANIADFFESAWNKVVGWFGG